VGWLSKEMSVFFILTEFVAMRSIGEKRLKYVEYEWLASIPHLMESDRREFC
jgi:hypothetical protein